MKYKIDKFFCFYNFSGKKHGAIPLSEINFYHLTFVLSGKVTYKVNGEEIVLNGNDALLLVPGTVRERYRSNEPAHYILFNYLPTAGNELSSPIVFRNTVNQTIRKLLDSYPYTYYRAEDHIDDPDSENSKINDILPNLFNCILTELFETLKYPTNNQNVLNALKYINDNITSPITLTDVSSAIHISKGHTARIFKKEMGMTVSQYINKQKITLAKDMLTSKELSIQDIAHLIGYENYGYFNKIFTSYFGMSPVKMKSQLKNK